MSATRLPPQPITFTLTAKEAASAHVLLDAIIDMAPEILGKHGDTGQLARARDELARRLTEAGCHLTPDGWVA